MEKRIIDWKTIRAEWEVGRSVNYLNAKYNLPKTRIDGRKLKERWKRSIELHSATETLKQTAIVIGSEMVGNNPKQQAMAEIIGEIVTSANLMATNLSLVKQAQLVLAEGFVDGKATLDNIKDISTTIKNLDGVVSDKGNINIHNNFSSIQVDFVEDSDDEQ